MEWYALVFIAIVIEGIITYAKTLFVERKIQWQIFFAMVLGVGCALAFNVDLFAIAGIKATVPYVGNALTGILLSRGSNYVFDLLGKITDAKVSTHEFERTAHPDETAEG